MTMVDTRVNQTLPKETSIPSFVTKTTEEDFIAHDRRTCDCPLTFVHRKRHGALGTGIEIRLCCLAKKVEELAGLPEGTFFETFEFEPTWVWDCNSKHKTKRTLPDGSVEVKEVKLGKPPKWILRRMEKKGIKVKGL